jgi:transporter family-2 protein
MTVQPASADAPSWLREAILIAAGAGSGALAAVAIAMVAAVGRERGGEEATWLHLLVLVAAMAVVIAVAARRGKAPAFERPLHSLTAVLALALVCGVVALASFRGLEWYYLLSGVVSMVIFLLITWLLVRVSLAFYFASNTLGMVFGSLALDQIGAFGAPEHDLTLPRVLGALLVVVGVVWVRTGK